MRRYGIPYSNQELITDSGSVQRDGYVRIFEDKPRPTPEHICSPDGLWILPLVTFESVALERKARYAAETDELKAHIEKDILMGENVDELLALFRERVSAIKADLPFPTAVTLPSHYKPVQTRPTVVPETLPEVEQEPASE